jgi:pimeloyl-ACP methyl ester carboxylesterase
VLVLLKEAPDARCRFATIVPNLRGVVDVPDCAHWTQQERPDLVTAALLDFLRGL